MVFMVVDTDNYDLLLGLDFLMKIGAVFDVKKGIIHVRNGPRMKVEVLPFNVLNILQVMEWLVEEKTRSELLNMKMERIILNDWTNLSQSSDPSDLHDEVSFDDEMMESQIEAKDGLERVLHNLENYIEELKDHGMDLVIDNEVPMQILNLLLQKQHQDILER
jgi:hypothetical protein